MTEANPLPSQAVLREMLSYDAETGLLAWKPTGSPQWNGRFAGKPALNWKDKRGYLKGSLRGRHVQAHRVIFKLVHGIDPDEIDHINGNPSDNRLENLRSVSHGVNGKNMRLSKASASGHTGISFVSRVGRWRAYINTPDGQRHLGYFEDFQEAIAARQQAERRFGFHNNHGSSGMFTNPHLLPKIRSEAIRAAAAGKPCSLRLPGICNHNPETTVLAHMVGHGKGMGTKVSDIHAVFACSNCHDAIDRHTYEKFGVTRAAMLSSVLMGICETQARLVAIGIILVPDAEIV